MENDAHQPLETLRAGLEGLYARYNKRCYVHPDPLEFLYDFPKLEDREIVGLIAASLAYGRVWSILDAVSACLKRLGPSPREFLLQSSLEELEMLFSDFGHRFVKGREMALFLHGIKSVIERYGRLEELFCAFDDEMPGINRTISRLIFAVRMILELSGMKKSYLLPDPAKKSACKRLFLFLRWMVRKDDVDPGGWGKMAPSELIVPLDTHMFNIARDIGLTSRRQPSLATAIEVTTAFSRICREDPVRYDFVLTRFGIRDELSRKDVPRLLDVSE